MSTDAAIARVVQWCRENAPGALARQLPGASDAAIAEAAAKTGVEWPEGMVALFRAINGEVRNEAQLIPNYQLLSLDEVVDQWQMLQDIRTRMRDDNGANEGDDDFGDPLVRDDDEAPEDRFLRKLQSAQSDDQVPQSAPTTWRSPLDLGADTASDFVEDVVDHEGDDKEEMIGGAEIWVASPAVDWGVYGAVGGIDEAAFDRELEEFRASLEHDSAADYGPLHPEIPERKAGSVTPNWVEPEFIPFASWDDAVLMVDLRPGQFHGCVIEWEPVDRSQGMQWTSLEAFFTELLASLESDARFMLSRPRVTAKGNIKWRMDD